MEIIDENVKNRNSLIKQFI